MEISYYEMTEDDIPSIAEMELEYFSVPWSEASIGHYMEQGNTLFIVARHNSSDGYVVAGYIALMCILNESELVSIAVRKGYRNMGIARELLDIAYGMAQDRGVELIHLEVRESNEAAIELYESEGFTKDGIRKGYYDKPKEDAVLYTKHFKE
ncbi:MAG: ribosomal-protein-alanine N-acetyltransferase [Lachnospiraceae bacterium]|nr:ribosomal-protein-alanine N-acetyltransferase [Lachnospiraceae bacterium]